MTARYTFKNKKTIIETKTNSKFNHEELKKNRFDQFLS